MYTGHELGQVDLVGEVQGRLFEAASPGFALNLAPKCRQNLHRR